VSSCAKCGGESFRVEELSPVGSVYRLDFMQCSGCGAPVGLTEHFNTGLMLEQLDKTMAESGGHLARIERAIGQIAHVLNSK
jgi:hypothetical protein